MARKATEKNPVRVKNIETLIAKEGLSKNAFSKKIGVALPNFLATMKSQKITEEFINKIRSVFPIYRKEWLMGLDTYMTDLDLGMSFFQHESVTENEKEEMAFNAVYDLASLSGINIAVFPNSDNIDSSLCYMLNTKTQKEGVMTISEFTDFSEKIRRYVEFELNNLLHNDFGSLMDTLDDSEP